LKQIPEGVIQLGKKLSKIIEDDTGITLTFADETVDGPFDLLIGADGIRSVSPPPCPLLLRALKPL
jgi:salicylate hydroxylase